MADFLLELFSEEIPARMQEDAAAELSARINKALAAEGLPSEIAASFVTPRRVAVVVKNLPAIQADTNTEKKGPKTSAPQAAIDGFLKSSGLSIDKLEKRMVGKDETYFAVIHKKGQPTADLLKSIIEKILGEFPWPKSMRWGSRNESWVRPLHSILCIFDGKVVPVEWSGIKASNVTYGHRFLAPGAITISNVDEYAGKLKDAKVLADRTERKTEILKQANQAASDNGLALKEDIGLANEVTGLVEWPTVLVGTIDAKYMDLPQEVLVSEMRAHQKYFALLTKNGTMSDKFLITSNMITTDGGKAVIAGNERVLRARLADGRFFFDQDRKKPLSDWAKGLSGVTFHAKIGTIADKVERVKKLTVALAEYVPGADKKRVERAAELCKADLVTGMVGEFPDLQGVMGRYYALAQKEDEAVADAIRDHYLPLGPDSPVPTKPVSICVALADKLDTLVSMFAAGEKPTGSKDPFALRRSALGIIRIILDNKLRMPLKTLLGEELLAFFSDRLKVQLKDQGIRHDVIDAVMAGGDDDLVRVVARAKALQDFLATEDGKNLLAGYKRAANIVGIEEKKDKNSYSYFGLNELETTKLKEVEETSLQQNLIALHKDIQKPLQEEDFNTAMQLLAKTRPAIDRFFDKIMVNADDKNVRENRLRLLASIRNGVDNIADFTKIEG
jgi:glycyl-tRNA synthetase beta chain